jgi:hypothetical protein
MAGGRHKKAKQVYVGQIGNIKVYFERLNFSVWADDLIVTGSVKDFFDLLRGVKAECNYGHFNVRSRDMVLTFKDLKHDSKLSIARIVGYLIGDAGEEYEYIRYFVMSEDRRRYCFVSRASANNLDELKKLARRLLNYFAPIATAENLHLYSAELLKENLEAVRKLKVIIRQETIKDMFQELVKVLEKELEEAEKRLKEGCAVKMLEKELEEYEQNETEAT